MNIHHSSSIDQAFKSLFSGGLAGAAAKTVVAPIQRIKFLYLTRSREFKYVEAYRDLIHIVKQYGFRNLWRGNLINLCRIVPQAALDFGCFDLFRRRFYINDGTLSSKLILFACGALSGFLSVNLLLPMDFLRVRMAMERDRLHYVNYQEAIKNIYKQQGFLGFYRGYLATMTGVVLIHGFGFFIFTKLKEFVGRKWPDKFYKWYTDFLIGVVTASGQFFAYPIDMVKKRMQGQGYLLQHGQITSYMSYGQLIRKMKSEGVKSFFKGFTVNIIKTPISLATSWTVKNQVNRYLDASYDL